MVAVIDSDLDTVHLLLTAFRQVGFAAVGWLAHTLRGRGFDLHTASDGLDFPSFIRRHNPDVVVFHVDLPYEENLRVFRQFRHTVLRGLPVALTTNDPHRLEHMLQPDDVVEVFVKPYDPADIVAFAQKAIRNRTTHRG